MSRLCANCKAIVPDTAACSCGYTPPTFTASDDAGSETTRSVWEEFEEIRNTVPPEEWEKLNRPEEDRLTAARREGAREAIEALFEECRRAITEYAGKNGPAGDLTDGIYVAMGIGVGVQNRYAEPEEKEET